MGGGGSAGRFPPGTAAILGLLRVQALLWNTSGTVTTYRMQQSTVITVIQIYLAQLDIIYVIKRSAAAGAAPYLNEKMLLIIK